MDVGQARAARTLAKSKPWLSNSPRSNVAFDCSLNTRSERCSSSANAANAAAAADGAGAVDVDHQAQPAPLGKVDDFVQRGDIAVEREHALGDDQRGAPLGVADLPPEVVGIEMVVDEHLGAGKPTAIDYSAGLCSSEKITSPGRARGAIVPALARYPDPNSSALGRCRKAASR